MVYIVLGTGFEEMEAICPCDILRRGGVEVRFAGIGGKAIAGGKGITVQADCTVEEIDYENLDMIVLPGGLGGVHSILASETAMNAVKWAYENEKYVAAICAAPAVLNAAGILEGRTWTCYPGVADQISAGTYTAEKFVIDGSLLGLQLEKEGAASKERFNVTIEFRYRGQNLVQLARLTAGPLDDGPHSVFPFHIIIERRIHSDSTAIIS